MGRGSGRGRKGQRCHNYAAISSASHNGRSYIKGPAADLGSHNGSRLPGQVGTILFGYQGGGLMSKCCDAPLGHHGGDPLLDPAHSVVEDPPFAHTVKLPVDHFFGH